MITQKAQRSGDTYDKSVSPPGAPLAIVPSRMLRMARMPGFTDAGASSNDAVTRAAVLALEPALEAAQAVPSKGESVEALETRQRRLLEIVEALDRLNVGRRFRRRRRRSRERARRLHVGRLRLAAAADARPNRRRHLTAHLPAPQVSARVLRETRARLLVAKVRGMTTATRPATLGNV